MLLSARLWLPSVQSEECKQLEASGETCSWLLQAPSHVGDMLGPFSRLEPPSAKGTPSHSPACNTHASEVPSPVRCLTRAVEPGVTKPSTQSKSGSRGNPLGKGALNPRGGAGLHSKPSAAGQSGDLLGEEGLNPKGGTRGGSEPVDTMSKGNPLGEGGLNPKGETDRQWTPSRGSESAFLQVNAHTTGNEGGSAWSSEGAGSALLHVPSLTGDMLGPFDRLGPPAAKDI